MKDPMIAYTTRLLFLYTFICICNYSYTDAAINSRTATIFGFGATRNDDSNQQSSQQQKQSPHSVTGENGINQLPYPPPPLSERSSLQVRPPPPPPPPPLQTTKIVDTSSDTLNVLLMDDLSNNQTQQVENDVMEHSDQQQQQQTMQSSLPPENIPPQRHVGPMSNPFPARLPFHQQQQQQEGRRNGRGDPSQQQPSVPPAFIIQGMQRDLEIAFQREQGLRAHLSNVTTQLTHMQQREDLHIRQLDVLTERVIETEATMAEERNELIQYKNNCTEMGKQIALLEGSVEEWKNKCREHLELTAQLRNESTALGKQLERMTLKAEDLATLVEKHRIAEQDDDNEYGTVPHQRKISSKKRGFWAWLFGWGSSVTPVDESLDNLREEARSTLIAALQRERETVEDLEATLTVLQRNNTALAEQVKSRDDILEELNDRIGVFEEDRIVLKAALRQLKKDMSEEAPKTQRMANELKSAKVEIDRLEKEMESLITSHEEEVAKLQFAIQDKQEALQMAESNLTMIGTYVSKLEERLGDFAVARREIEIREEKCLEIENRAEEENRARMKLEDEIAALQQEHQDFRELIEDLIQARSRLKLESDQLRNERDTLKLTQTRLKENVDDLRSKIISLQNENDALTSRYHSLEQQYNATQESLVDMQGQLVSNEEFEALANKLKLLEDSKVDVEAELQRLQQEKQTTSHEALAALSALESKEKEISDLQNAINSLKIETDRQLESSQQSLHRTANLLAEAKDRVTSLEDELTKAKRNEEMLLEKVKAVQESFMTERYHDNKGPKPAVPPLPFPNVTKSQEKKVEDFVVPKNHTKLSKIDKEETKEDQTSRNKDVATASERNVPLRNLRKKFAKLTGIHGLITKPSQSSGEARLRKNQPGQVKRHTQLSPVSQQSHNSTNTSSTSGRLPPSLPRIMSHPPLGVTNTTRVNSQEAATNERKIPLRKFRKFCSKMTGVHGLLSPPSKPRQYSKKTSLPRKPTPSVDNKVRPPPLNGKSQPVEVRSTMPVSLRPEVVKNSVEGLRQPPSTTLDPK